MDKADTYFVLEASSRILAAELNAYEAVHGTVPAVELRNKMVMLANDTAVTLWTDLQGRVG